MADSVVAFMEQPYSHSTHTTNFTGDLYGGAHYLQSSSATMTPQGRAIREASIRFGDGTTLPFTPCKRGYLPFNSAGDRMVACSLHHAKRWKRLVGKDGSLTFRKGEVNLNETFWQTSDPSDAHTTVLPTKHPTRTYNVKELSDSNNSLKKHE